jgi:hypothetical protein
VASISKQLSAALALAGVILPVVGCGEASRSKPLTRAELTAKADAICRRVIGQVDWSKVNPESLPSQVDRLAALEEQAAGELDKLTPPPAMADEWRLIVDGFKLTGPEFKQIAHQVKESPQAYPSIPLSNAQHERGLAANIAGIKDCAKY